jgi:uncharacterized protein (DUF2235 family)
MAKNIVICFDGTGNQLKAKGNTNVVRLFEMLDLSDPTKQIAYYDPGVGTFSSAGAWTIAGRKFTKIMGLAFGTGLRTNLGEAYTYLMNTYEDGDRLYVFGFSRGAYNARALAGLLRLVGLLRPGSENLVSYAVSVYGRNKGYSADDWSQVHQFAGAFARHVGGSTTIPIEFMGVWDTVKAAGLFKWDLHWPYTRQIPNVRTVRHAMSIDEKRRPFKPYPIEVSDKPPIPNVQEVWFAGVHSDVGGTFDDDPRLPQIALKWIVEGAMESGLLLREGAYAAHCSVVPGNALGKVHKMGWVWILATYARRTVPAGANVHSSVKERLVHEPKYGSNIPKDSVIWADPSWVTPKL